MSEEGRSDKVLKALNWEPQKKTSQVRQLGAVLLQVLTVFFASKPGHHVIGLCLQDSFFSAVQDNIDALGMTVWSPFLANSTWGWLHTAVPRAGAHISLHMQMHWLELKVCLSRAGGRSN